MLLYDFKLFDKEKIKTETGIHYEPQCYITEYAWKRIRVHMGNKFNSLVLVTQSYCMASETLNINAWTTFLMFLKLLAVLL